MHQREMWYRLMYWLILWFCIGDSWEAEKSQDVTRVSCLCSEYWSKQVFYLDRNWPLFIGQTLVLHRLSFNLSRFYLPFLFLIQKCYARFIFIINLLIFSPISPFSPPQIFPSSSLPSPRCAPLHFEPPVISEIWNPRGQGFSWLKLI